jgi:hypothetical protein
MRASRGTSGNGKRRGIELKHRATLPGRVQKDETELAERRLNIGIGYRSVWNFVYTETTGCRSGLSPVHWPTNPRAAESSLDPPRSSANDLIRSPSVQSYFDLEKPRSRLD